eukprot:g1599.t1
MRSFAVLVIVFVFCIFAPLVVSSFEAAVHNDNAWLAFLKTLDTQAEVTAELSYNSNDKPYVGYFLRSFENTNQTYEISIPDGVEIPDYVTGLDHYRLLPGYFPDPMHYHFDGLATVMKFSVSSDGKKISYFAKQYASDASTNFKRCIFFGTGTGPTLGTHICFTNPGVNLLPIEGQLWLTIDTANWGRVDMDTLETVQGAKANISSLVLNAHPACDRKNNVCYVQHPCPEKTSPLSKNICFSVLKTSELNLQTEVVGKNSLNKSKIIQHSHSPCVTENYVVSKIDAFEFRNILNKNSGLLKYLRQQEDDQWFIMNRKTMETKVLRGNKAFINNHFWNCYEDSDQNIVVETVAATEDYLDNYFATSLASPTTDFSKIFHEPLRCKIDYQSSETVSCGPLLSENDNKMIFDYPTFNPHYKMRKDYQYFYGIAITNTSSSKWFDRAIKVDVTQGKVVADWSAPNIYLSEFDFIPKSGDAEEDDGTLVSLLYNNTEDASYLAFFSAKTMQPFMMEKIEAGVVPFHAHGIICKNYYQSLGLRYFRNKNFKAAIRVLTDALIKFPSNKNLAHTLSWIVTEKKSHQDRCKLFGNTVSAREVLSHAIVKNAETYNSASDILKLKLHSLRSAPASSWLNIVARENLRYESLGDIKKLCDVAALKIQNCWFQHNDWQIENAIVIQRIYRGHVTRLAIRRKRLLEYWSITPFQALFRGFLLRLHFHKKRRAIIMCQSLVRRLLARRVAFVLRMMRQEKFLKQKCIIIQRWIKTLLQVFYFRNLRLKTITIQSWVRTCNAKRYFRTILFATVKIQSVVRMFQNRKIVAERRHALAQRKVAIFCQRMWFRVRATRRKIRKNRSATMLQKVYRSFSSRRSAVKKLKERAWNELMRFERELQYVLFQEALAGKKARRGFLLRRNPRLVFSEICHLMHLERTREKQLKQMAALPDGRRKLQRARLLHLFEQVDSRCIGWLNRDQLGKLLRKLYFFTITPREIENVWRVLDPKNRERVYFESFFQWYTHEVTLGPYMSTFLRNDSPHVGIISIRACERRTRYVSTVAAGFLKSISPLSFARARELYRRTAVVKARQNAIKSFRNQTIANAPQFFCQTCLEGFAFQADLKQHKEHDRCETILRESYLNRE